MKLQQFDEGKKLIISTMICVFILVATATGILASETDPGLITPTDDQYFELRAVEVKDVEGQNKQVIMQLWGNNLEFRRI